MPAHTGTRYSARSALPKGSEGRAQATRRRECVALAASKAIRPQALACPGGAHRVRAGAERLSERFALAAARAGALERGRLFTRRAQPENTRQARPFSHRKADVRVAFGVCGGGRRHQDTNPPEVHASQD